jgi:hypothetical protein
VSAIQKRRDTGTSVSALSCIRLWRVPTDQNPAPPGADQQRSVELQRDDRRTSDRGQAEDLRPFAAPREVLIPALRTWIEQWHEFMRLRILGVRLRSLDLVTRAAGAPQIFAHSQTTSGNRYDMLGAESYARQRLIGAAIPAAMPRISQNLTLKLN